MFVRWIHRFKHTKSSVIRWKAKPPTTNCKQERDRANLKSRCDLYHSTYHEGLKVFVREDDISFSSDPAELLECDVIMLCMKLTALEDSLKALLVVSHKKLEK